MPKSIEDCLSAATEIVDDKARNRIIQRATELGGDKFASQKAVNAFANEYGRKLHGELNDLKKSISHEPKKFKPTEFTPKTKGNSEEINKSYDKKRKALENPVKISEADAANTSIKDDKNVGDYVAKAKSVLESLYPNAKLEVYDNEKAYTGNGGESGTRGYAILDKDGNHRILLNLEQIKEDKSGKTAFHEVIHPIVYDAFGVDNSKLVPLWNDIASSMKDVKGMDKVFDHIVFYSNDKVAPEGITELLTQIAAGNIDLSSVPKSTANKIIDLINNLFEKLGINLKLNSVEDFNSIATKIKDAFDKGNVEDLKDIIKGKNIDKYIADLEKKLTEKDLSPEEFNKTIKELKDLGLSNDEIRNALKQENYSDEKIKDILSPKTEANAGKEQPKQEKINEGGKPPKEPPSIETDKEEKQPERKFTQQMMRDEDLVPESKKEIEKTLSYVKQSNTMSIAEAKEAIDKLGEDEAQNLVMNDGDVKPAVRVVMGQSLIKRFNDLASKAPDEATKNHYIDKTIQTAKFVTEKLATEPGQMIQAFSLYSRLSPEAQLRDAVQDVQKQAKEKIRRRTGDVNKIGDKFKKANEETVGELTKSKTVKKSVEQTENKRIKKAQDKIAQARKKRAEILKKYKSDKGKNLYAGIGLTNEGIEFVGNIAKTYIDEGIADLQLLVEKIRQHLEDASKKPINDDVNKNVTDIAQQFLDKESNKNVAKSFTELEKSIGEIVRKHYTVSEESKKSLTDKFISDAGLDKEDAAQLAKEIQTEFDKIATRKKQNILYNEKARFEKVQKGLQGANKVEAKTLQDEMIKYSNLGAFENPQFAEMIADKLGLGKITPEQGKEISRLSDIVQNAPEGSPKNDATQDLLKYRANIKGNTWMETAQGIWYANVLSGYATHLKNIVSTFFNGMAFYGAEAVRNPKSIPFLTVGGIKGLSRGAAEAWHTITTGRSPIHILKVETPGILERKQFIGGYLNPANYLKFVGRLLTAEDVLQFQGLKEMRATQLAYREAAQQGFKSPFSKETWRIVNEKLLNTKERYDLASQQVKDEGLIGTEATRRTYELMEQSRPLRMTEDAYGFAAKGTFNHESEGTLGALTNAVSHALDINIGGARPLRFIVPFTRIITNVVNTGLDFTPIGYIRALRAERGFKSFEQSTFTKGAHHELTKEERNQLIARASLGIGLTAAMYGLSQIKDKDGNQLVEITGGGTGNYKRDAQLKQEGWQPYSIKIGDTYISYRLSPLFFSLGFVGNMNDADKYGAKEDDKTFTKRLELASFRVGQQVADLTWINSAGTFLGAFADNASTSALGANVGNSISQTVKGFVIPQGYTQAAQEFENIFDVPQKQVNGLWQNLVQDIPIARNSLNDKVNALGDPVIRDNDLMFSKQKEDKVWQYLLEKNGWVAPINKNSLITFDIETKQDRPATNDEYYEFSKIRGQKIKSKIEQLLSNGAYTNADGTIQHKTAEQLSSFEVKKLLTDFATDATKETKLQMFQKQIKPKTIVRVAATP